MPGLVFTQVPSAAFLEMNADKIADSFGLAIFNPAYEPAAGVFDGKNRIDRYRLIHLDARSRGRDILKSGNLIVDLARIVLPMNIQ
jgi:hypothetical protein